MIKQTIDKYLGRFLVFLMVLITLDVLWGVFTRYILGHQAGWTEELARFLLIWIGILGAAFASGQKAHLSINLLEPKLSLVSQKRLKQIIALFILFFAVAVLVVGGMRLVYITQVLQQHSAALQIPMAMVYTIVPVSGLLIIFYQIYFLREISKIHIEKPG